jgi:hypothetical protein
MLANVLPGYYRIPRVCENSGGKPCCSAS